MQNKIANKRGKIMTDFKDIIKPKEKEEEVKKNEDVFTQIQREMLKASILKMAMLASQMSEMSGNRDYSDPISMVQQAEVTLENTLKGLSEETRKTYFDQVKERADIEGSTEIDVMAKDAIELKKAEKNNDDYQIDPSTGRVVVEGKEKNSPDKDDEEELDEPELSL